MASRATRWIRRDKGRVAIPLSGGHHPRGPNSVLTVTRLLIAALSTLVLVSPVRRIALVTRAFASVPVFLARGPTAIPSLAPIFSPVLSLPRVVSVAGTTASIPSVSAVVPADAAFSVPVGVAVSVTWVISVPVAVSFSDSLPIAFAAPLLGVRLLVAAIGLVICAFVPVAVLTGAAVVFVPPAAVVVVLLGDGRRTWVLMSAVIALVTGARAARAALAVGLVAAVPLTSISAVVSLSFTAFAGAGRLRRGAFSGRGLKQFWLVRCCGVL